MLTLAIVMLKKSITGILSLCLTEKMVTGIVLELMEYLARKSKMDVDDKIIASLKAEYDKKYN